MICFRRIVCQRQRDKLRIWVVVASSFEFTLDVIHLSLKYNAMHCQVTFSDLADFNNPIWSNARALAATQRQDLVAPRCQTLAQIPTVTYVTKRAMLPPARWLRDVSLLILGTLELNKNHLVLNLLLFYGDNSIILCRVSLTLFFSCGAGRVMA